MQPHDMYAPETPEALILMSENTTHPVKKLRKTVWSALLLTAMCMALTPLSVAGEVEVLHHWTSGAEAKSLQELKDAMRRRGHQWKDFAVKGGGGGNAMTQLKARVLAHDAPAAALIKGPAIQEWAELQVLTSLDAMASYDHWDKKLPPVIAGQMQYQGHYVAVPINVHRVNWLWANANVLKKVGITSMPHTMQAFFQQAEKIQRAGFIPVAHGGQPWQDFTTFESVALSAGSDFYRNALVELNPAVINSPEMRNVLQAFRRIKALTDSEAPGRQWNAATRMVITGQAAFQFMGDWAKGEFLNAGKKPDRDFYCAPAPGTRGTFSYNVDSFAMFKRKTASAEKAQGYLAYLIMGNDFQKNFNMRKGSIPANLQVSMADFDNCARQSHSDFRSSSADGTLLPSIAHSMAVATAQEVAIRDIISAFWNDDRMSADTAIAQMLEAVRRQPQAAGKK